MKTLILILTLAAASMAQTNPIGAPIFAGTGLNDATSGGTFAGVAAPHSYVVSVCAAATPDTIQVSRDGAAAGSCTAVTGAAQAVGDGVTIRLAATTGHTVGDQWTIRYSVSGSVAASSYYQQGGRAVSRSAEEKLREVISSSDFKPTGDGTANDQVALQAAIDATPDGGGLLVLPGTYAVCSLHVQRKKFAMYAYVGSGTSIVRHSSCLNATGTGGPLLRADYSASLTLRDLYFDQKGDNIGSGFSNSASTIYCWYCSSVRMDHVTVTRAQANAIAVFAANDVQITNSTVSKYWWNGIVVSGDANDLSHVASTNRIVLSGNTGDDGPFCFLVTVAAHDVAMNNNVCTKSGMGVVQIVDHLTAVGNVFHGANTHGLAGSNECMFFEAPTQFLIANNYLSGCANNGIDVVGSQITDGFGVTQQLPVVDGLIANNEMEDIGAACVQIIAQSYSHSAPGSKVKTQGNHCLRATTGYSIGAINGYESSGDTAEEIQTNGMIFSVVQNAVVNSAVIRNVSKLSANSYYGIVINGNGTQNIDINDSVIIDQLGNMRFGIKDEAIDAGYTSQLRHHGNIIRGGATGIPMYPDPVTPPAIGTFLAGDIEENFPKATGDPLGWICTSTGTPTGTCSTGKWRATGYLDPDGRYVLSTNGAATGVSAPALTLTNNSSGDQDYIKMKAASVFFGRIYRPAANNDLRFDAYDSIRLKPNQLGGSGGKIELDGNVNSGGNLTGTHLQNLGTTDSPTFYVPTVSKLSLADFFGTNTGAYAIVSDLNPLSKKLYVQDSSGVNRLTMDFTLNKSTFSGQVLADTMRLQSGSFLTDITPGGLSVSGSTGITANAANITALTVSSTATFGASTLSGTHIQSLGAGDTPTFSRLATSTTGAIYTTEQGGVSTLDSAGLVIHPTGAYASRVVGVTLLADSGTGSVGPNLSWMRQHCTSFATSPCIGDFNALRWVMGADWASETGSSNGTDFFISRFGDSGSYLGDALTIKRSSGLVTMGATTLTGALTGTSATFSGSISVSSCSGCGSGGVTSVSASSPLASSGGSTPTISCSSCVHAASSEFTISSGTLSMNASTFVLPQYGSGIKVPNFSGHTGTLSTYQNSIYVYDAAGNYKGEVPVF